MVIMTNEELTIILHKKFMNMWIQWREHSALNYEWLVVALSSDLADTYISVFSSFFTQNVIIWHYKADY